MKAYLYQAICVTAGILIGSGGLFAAQHYGLTARPIATAASAPDYSPRLGRIETLCTQAVTEIKAAREDFKRAPAPAVVKAKTAAK